MHRNDLKIIKGGNTGPANAEKTIFESAYVTDTRLMGVVGVHIHWILENPSCDYDMHQFFYFDAEEYGLETYKSYVGNETLPLSIMEKAIIGGLGGKKMDLTERQARWLVQQFVHETRLLKAPLADPFSEYEFVLDPEIMLSAQELDSLATKMCTKIESNWQLVHYYLMRTFGHDPKGASYLIAPSGTISPIAESKPATLCKNTIEEYLNPDGTLSYLSESLIEVDGNYKIIVSDIIASHGKVISAQKRSGFSVSAAEVAMLLNRPEFITLFEILVDPEDFDRAASDYTAGSLQTVHDNGRLFMEFNRNNDHVNRRVFRLNEDVHGLYYVSDYGQMLLAAYSLEDIRDLEARLHKSQLNLQIVPTAKYEFKEPVLYEFIQSDYEDFNDFLESIQVHE